MTDLLMRTALIQTRLLGGDVVRSFVFRTILSANLNHLSPAAVSAELTVPSAEGSTRRPVSVHAVAQSLSLPYETVRSRVIGLIDGGWCVREPGGIRVPAAVLARADYQDAILEIHRDFIAAVRVLKRIAFDFDSLAASAALPPVEDWTPVSPPPAALVVHLVMELQQRHLEVLMPMFGDITRGFIWAGVLQANVRRLLAEPEAAWAYAGQDSPPPDELRTPVSVHALARALNMPYETVRRHVAALVAEGRLVREPGLGVLAPAMSVGEDGLGRGNAQLMMRFTRMVAELARFGFDFDDPR